MACPHGVEVDGYCPRCRDRQRPSRRGFSPGWGLGSSPTRKSIPGAPGDVYCCVPASFAGVQQ